MDNLIIILVYVVCIGVCIFSYITYKKRINKAYIICVDNLNINYIVAMLYGILLLIVVIFAITQIIPILITNIIAFYCNGRHMEIIKKDMVVSQLGEWRWDSLLEHEWGELFMKDDKSYYDLWLTFKNDESRRKSTGKSQARIYLKIGKEDKSKVEELIEINS